MYAVVSCSYIWTGKRIAWAHILVIMPCMKKWSGRQMAEDYQQKFYEENVEKFIKFINIFRRQNFVPYSSYAKLPLNVDDFTHVVAHFKTGQPILN